jgi:hypothetical protein
MLLQPLAVIVLLGVPDVDFDHMSREELLMHREAIADAKPGLGGAVGMMAGGSAAILVGGLFAYAMPHAWDPTPHFSSGLIFSAEAGRSAWYFGMGVGILGMVACAAGVALEVLGVRMLVKRIEERSKFAAVLEAIDLRLGP